MKIEYVFRCPFHYVAGAIAALASLVSPALTIGCILIFVFYELDQDWHIKDRAYHDLREYMVAFYITIAGVLLWKLL